MRFRVLLVPLSDVEKDDYEVKPLMTIRREDKGRQLDGQFRTRQLCIEYVSWMSTRVRVTFSDLGDAWMFTSEDKNENLSIQDVHDKIEKCWYFPEV